MSYNLLQNYCQTLLENAYSPTWSKQYYKSLLRMELFAMNRRPVCDSIAILAITILKNKEEFELFFNSLNI